MKSLILLLALFTAIGTAFASETPLPHVRAQGTAVMQLVPDLLKWRLRVSTIGPDVAGVAEEQTKRTNALLDFLKQHGVDTEKTQTARMHLSENLVFRNNSQVREGFVAATDVEFTSTDLAAYREIWLGLARLTGVSVQTSGWDTSKRIETQNAMRSEAVKAARAKAMQMAEAAGARVGEPLAIVEIPSEPDAIPMGRNVMFSAMEAGQSGDPVAPGVIPVRAQVEVTFRLISTP